MDGESAWEIQEAMLNSKAYEIHDRIVRHNISLFVCEQNYADLHRFLLAATKPEHLHIYFNPHQSQPIHYTGIRLFQNYVISARVLSEYTLQFIEKWYSGTSIRTEYEQQKAKYFHNNDIAAFIYEMRNFVSHYSIPLTGTGISIIHGNEENAQEQRVKFYLVKEELLKWDNWKKGKKFIDASGSEIDILYVIETYHKSLMKFYDWLNNRLEEYHSSQFKWLEEMQEKLDKAIGRKRG